MLIINKRPLPTPTSKKYYLYIYIRYVMLGTSTTAFHQGRLYMEELDLANGKTVIDLHLPRIGVPRAFVSYRDAHKLPLKLLRFKKYCLHILRCLCINIIYLSDFALFRNFMVVTNEKMSL